MRGKLLPAEQLFQMRDATEPAPLRAASTKKKFRKSRKVFIFDLRRTFAIVRLFLIFFSLDPVKRVTRPWRIRQGLFSVRGASSPIDRRRRRLLLSVMTNKRECGKCSLCCKLAPIRELNKPIDAWCPHCRPGHGGCTI
jgi:hypothetical protein